MRYPIADASIVFIVFIVAGGPALPAQSLAVDSGTKTGSASPTVRHVIGLEHISSQKSGKLTVRNGEMQFAGGKEVAKVAITSIDGIFVGSETTQAGGKAGRVVKTAAMAAPYESGRVLSLLMRAKVDILTISYHETGGALHAAIFALPIGQGSDMRTQLIAAGARESASAGQELKERAQP
jgi:hypothetical protein